jgi:uncharacterized repeat protein (TIGR01451 family)
MRKILLLMGLVMSGVVMGQAPVITYFAPKQAAIGCGVSIYGNNFNPIANRNIVLFGSVMAKVFYTTPTSIIVGVPSGATNSLISVTNLDNNLTSYSSQQFTLTYIPTKSLEFISQSIATDAFADVKLSDFDGDGKSDILTSNYTSSYKPQVRIYQNISTKDSITLGNYFKIDSIQTPLEIADINGDGKLDLIFGVILNSTIYGRAIRIYENTSTMGHISFSKVYEITAPAGIGTSGVPLGANTIKIADIDGDGKSDIVTDVYNRNGTLIFRNNSVIGNYSFDSAKTNYCPSLRLAVGDFNNDTKPDIVGSTVSNGLITIAENKSTPGNILFSYLSPINVYNSNPSSPSDMKILDLNNDGRNDIVVSLDGGTSKDIFLVENNGINSSLSFKAARTLIRVNPSLFFYDIDGDGLVDNIYRSSPYAIKLYKNVSTNDSIFFKAGINLVTNLPYSATSTNLSYLTAGDLNGDGKVDIVGCDLTNLSLGLALLLNNQASLNYAVLPSITGHIFIDNNNNALQDSLEGYKSNVKIELSNGQTTFTDKDGYYQIQADSIGSYTLTVTPPTGYNATPASVTYNFTSYDTTITKDIALQPTTVLDSIAINVIPLVMNAVQGGAMPYWVQYTNAGTTTLSPTVALTYNNYLLAYDSCTDANATPLANGVVTSELNMQPGTTNNFISYFTVKPSANVGNTLTTVYSITTPTINQTDSFFMIIEGGVAQPNAQRATSSITTAQVASGKDIVYTIGFKNTGNDTAYNVVITDTLSNLLRANTVQMISSSHTCKTTVKGNIVTFELLNIKLPKATTNNLKSMGFVSFKVKPLPTLVAGNIITNKANTYYNYRAAQSTIATTVVKNIITPVRITNYELRMTGEKQITNYWTTSTEINTSHFNIQRSENGREFKTVGKVAAEGTGSYSFTDPLTTNNLPLTIYYRLEIVDKDGSKTYSDIKQIRLNQLTNQLINVYPNPAKDVITISSKESFKVIKIINQLGQVLQHISNINKTSYIEHLTSYTKGIYIVQIVTANGEVKNKKLIVE